MKKLISTILIFGLALGISSCKNEPAETSATTVETKTTVTLINHMSEEELSKTSKTDLMLLDDPWNTDDASSKFKGKVALRTRDKEALTADPDERSWAEEMPDDYVHIDCAYVNGHIYYELLPTGNYDGGEGSMLSIHLIGPDMEQDTRMIDYSDFEDFKVKLKADLEERKEDGSLFINPAEVMYEDLVTIYEAVIDKTYVQMTREEEDELKELRYEETGPDLTWDFDEDKVSGIKDSIDEYHFYDDALETNFTVHVITPPEYDPNTEYPVLVMTDAVWRFNDVAMLWEKIKDGRTPFIMVTVGLGYDTDNTDNGIRAKYFCDNKKEFLDFLTDDMMPYLSENYDLDLTHSVLFGHSQGGVLAHYAAFNSDRYENQPFSGYIIGSPAFWTPYFTCVSDWEDYKNDYGFFERNDKISKKILVTGGSDEDEDYAEYYEGNESTLEGIESLKERTGVEVRIYKSHHYQYIPEMLDEITAEGLFF